MKKIISLILTMFIVFSLSACGCSNSSQDGSGRLSVVATIFPYYDFAKQVAGKAADVEMLISPGSDIHSYEPTPSDIMKVEDCDLFIYNGGESDEWVEKMLESIDEGSRPKTIKMMNYITPIIEQDADHRLGDENDEHIWTSPVNAENLTGIISSNMIRLDQKNKNIYEENYKSYTGLIGTVHKSLKDITSNSNKKKIIVGDRFPLIYFTTLYGLDWECAFPGCSSETEPSLSRLSQLQKTIKQDNIKCIFKLNLSENNVADTLAQETGAKVLTFYSCENVSQQDFNNGESYVSLMTRNYTALKEALS